MFERQDSFELTIIFCQNISRKHLWQLFLLILTFYVNIYGSFISQTTIAKGIWPGVDLVY